MRATLLLASILAWAITFGFGAPAMAQGQFRPVVTINDSVVTQYELTQRRRLLEVFRTPGDLNEQAREALIEDRLKQQELRRFNLSLSDEALQSALEEFAGRANMNLDQFTRMLRQNGVDIATLRDFVSVGTAWRDYIRSRFGRQVNVTEADIDRAIAGRGARTTGIEVLLNEIIIAAPPDQTQRVAQAQRAADQISRFRSFAAFEDAARQVSALPSRENGGRLGWLPVENYPPQLQSLLLDLRPGEVTEPIDIPNGIALFQMRGVREVRRPVQPPSSIDYAAYYIDGASAEARQRAASDVADSVDTCDDLYGVARNQPTEVLERNNLAPIDIPADIALELARLDPGEVSYNVTRNEGRTLVFLMLCGRTAVGQGEISRDLVRNQLRSQRLSGLADALLEDLRASAVITFR